MKKLILSLASCLVCSSLPAFAGKKIETVCGFDIREGVKIRLNVVLHEDSQFSKPKIVSVNEIKPQLVESDKDSSSAFGFGFQNHEGLILKLNGCEGTAVYKYYDRSMPMNPMRDLNLQCVCPILSQSN